MSLPVFCILVLANINSPRKDMIWTSQSKKRKLLNSQEFYSRISEPASRTTPCWNVTTSSSCPCTSISLFPSSFLLFLILFFSRSLADKRICGRLFKRESHRWRTRNLPSYSKLKQTRHTSRRKNTNSRPTPRSSLGLRENSSRALRLSPTLNNNSSLCLSFMRVYQ